MTILLSKIILKCFIDDDNGSSKINKSMFFTIYKRRKKMRYLHVELPSLHLVWKRPGKKDWVCSVIRTNYPKPSALLVSAIMREAGFEVKVVDMKIHNQDTITPYREFTYEDGLMIASRKGMIFEEVNEEIRWAEVIGLTINPTSWANIALDFVKHAKSINPKIKVWVGGTDPTFRPNFYLKQGVDAVIRGEGEDLADKLLTNSSACGVTTNNMDNGIARGCDLDRSPLQALDLFKEDIPLWNTPIEGWNLLDHNIQPPIGFLFATRGCNQRCAYCTTPAKYGALRFKSLAKIKAELEHFKAYGIKTINIWDDSLSSLIKLGRKEHLLNIVRLLKSMGFAYEFSQGMVIKDLWDKQNNKPDEELISELFGHEIHNGQWVGCYAEYFPFEFLQYEDPRGAAQKLMSYDKELKVMETILEQGIRWLTYSCILGRPEDGPKEFQLATQRLNEVTAIIESYGAMGLPTPFMYSVFPGAKLWKTQPVKLNYEINKYPELYQLNATPHGTTFFTPGELMEAKKELEKNVLTPNQCKRLWSEGRYTWKKPVV